MSSARRVPSDLVGLRRLVRLILRRDRMWAPLWVLGLAGVVVVSGASVMSLYDTPAAIRSYAEVAGDNPALVLFAGPGHGFDDPNIGTVLVNETLLWGAIGAALMSIFAVVRHTRAEEETERADLVRGSVVGRHAPLTAALLVAVAMNAAVFTLAALGLIAAGYGVTGTIALSGAVAAAGVAFAGVAAVAAQIAAGARGAIGLASIGLGVAFALRGIGDVADNWVSWTSPLGWALHVRAFAGERWWTLGLCVAFALALGVLAVVLALHRDLGSGILTEHGGPGAAARWIIPPTGLALRLQRASIVAWSVGVAATGAVFGTVGNDVGQMFEDNPDLAEFIELLEGMSITDAFFVTAMRMTALLVGGFALSSILRARTEEMRGRAEPIIATATSRSVWWAGQVVVTAIGTVIVTVAGGAGAGVAYAMVVGDVGEVARMVGAALATLPAVAVLVAFALAVYGLVPRAVPAVWGVYAAVLVSGILGETLRLPGWVRDLSPFEHLPQVPARGVSPAPLLVLAAIAGALAAAGWYGFRRRDLAVS